VGAAERLVRGTEGKGRVFLRDGRRLEEVSGAVRPASSETGTLKMSLSGAGMTALHRVGLAGLSMTLRALEGDRRIEAAGGSWSLSAKDVTLRWGEGDPGSFFDALIDASFRVDDEGLVWFPALGEPSDNKRASAFLNECLLNTFLQHPRTRKADPGNRPTGAAVEVVEETEFPLRYRRVMGYQHQKVRIADPSAPQRLVGWVYPGSVVRHEAFGLTEMKEPLDRFLPLLYSMIGSLYFRVRGRGARSRVQYAVVMPEVADLARYSMIRARFASKGERDLTVSGPGEAALRVLSTIEAEKLMGAVLSTACRVVSFGRVPWDRQQKRVRVFEVRREGIQGLRVFRLCSDLFQPRLVKPRAGTPFWDYAQAPELVAENLLVGRPWWAGFSDYVADKKTRDHIYSWERDGLASMVQSPDGAPETAAQRAFVEACQEAWRRRLGALGARSRAENTSFSDLAGREFERTRVSFSRCKNAASLREAVTDFWARAGSLQSLGSGWRDVLALLNGDWRLAKDLALLALASYAPKASGEGEQAAAAGT
jgi:CRISPR-associated protein Cas8a1/Csx13